MGKKLTKSGFFISIMRRSRRLFTFVGLFCLAYSVLYRKVNFTPPPLTCRNVPLKPYLPDKNNNSDFHNRIFFLETSGRPYLSSREACAVESAALSTGLQEIVVLVKSETLKLSEDDLTCKLANEFTHKVKFHRLQTEWVIEDEAFQKAFTKFGQFRFPKDWKIYVSDFLRLIYVFKFGGWYADLDFVFRKSMLPSDNPEWAPNLVTGVFITRRNRVRLSNCIFKFKAGHKFLGTYIKKFEAHLLDDEAGKGHRAVFGPPMLTKIFKEKCGHWNPSKEQSPFEPPYNSKCKKDVTLAHPNVFVPIRFAKQTHLGWIHYNPRDPEKHWNKINKDAHGVHFYGSSAGRFRITGDSNKEDYSFLGKQFCPISLPYLK